MLERTHNVLVIFQYIGNIDVCEGEEETAAWWMGDRCKQETRIPSADSSLLVYRVPKSRPAYARPGLEPRLEGHVQKEGKRMSERARERERERERERGKGTIPGETYTVASRCDWPCARGP